VITLLTVFLTSLKPAAPTVDRATLWVDSVRRGEMVREVRGPGTLVPEHIRFHHGARRRPRRSGARSAGAACEARNRVTRPLEPRCADPALQAEQQLAAVEPSSVSQHTNLENQRLTQTGIVATTRTEYFNAKREGRVAESLGARGGMSRNEAAWPRTKRWSSRRATASSSSASR